MNTTTSISIGSDRGCHNTNQYLHRIIINVNNNYYYYYNYYNYYSKNTKPTTTTTPTRRRIPRHRHRIPNGRWYVLLGLGFVFLSLSMMGIPGCEATATTAASSAAAAVRTSAVRNKERNDNEDDSDDSNSNSTDIRVVFTDVDGTLVHYGSDNHGTDTNIQEDEDEDENDPESQGQRRKSIRLSLPASSTGLEGVISTRTLELAREIRRSRSRSTTQPTTNSNANANANTKLVVVSGMRTSTLLQRLPFLPKADAYCSENGGRIFCLVEDDDDDDDGDVIWVHPHRYPVADDSIDNDNDDDSNDDDDRFRPFAIREDPTWKHVVASALSGGGKDPKRERAGAKAAFLPEESLPLYEREGPLWDFVRHLERNHGIVPDGKGYAACVRIRQKQQTRREWTSEERSPEAFCEALRGLLREWQQQQQQPDPEARAADVDADADHGGGISCSVNLGCVDFYPSVSGKKGCALYLVQKWFGSGWDDNDEDDQQQQQQQQQPTTTVSTTTVSTTTTPTEFCRRHAVLLCDDDNDLELARACSRAYLPGAASPTIARLTRQQPDQFVAAFSGSSCKGTDATDRALEWVLEAVVR